MSFRADCYCWQGLFNARYCEDCIKFVGRNLNSRALRLKHNALPLLAISQYEGGMKNFIVSCKSSLFQGLMPAQRNFLNDLIDFWNMEIQSLKIDCVTVVPGHPLRSRIQTDLAWELARSVTNKLSSSLVDPEPKYLLKRKLFNENFDLWSSQKLKKRKERLFLQNQNPFYVTHPNLQSGCRSARRVLLVDDVSTTGSTLSICAEKLEKAGYTVAAFLILSRVESKA